MDDKIRYYMIYDAYVDQNGYIENQQYIVQTSNVQNAIDKWEQYVIKNKQGKIIKLDYLFKITEELDIGKRVIYSMRGLTKDEYNIRKNLVSFEVIK